MDPLTGVAAHNRAPSLWEDASRYWAHLNEVTADLPTPLVALHEPALMENARRLVARAQGLPIRVASKSLRVRGVLEEVLRVPGYRGVLAYTLAEALWLSRTVQDVVVGYPSVDRHSIGVLATDARAAANITLMVDDIDQLDLIDSVCDPHQRETIRVCIDLDASLRIGSLVHLGVHRSPVHTPEQAVDLARLITARRGFRLVGVMSYEAQIAGVANQPGGLLRAGIIRAMQSVSTRELVPRRGRAVQTIRQLCDLEFVNGGGTGSLERTAQDPSITEVTAGTGLFGPHLFDHFRDFQPVPAVGFAADVVRIPRPGTATLLGGGWVASGQQGRDRLPKPVWPAPLRLLPVEGAGEVQTPVRGTAAQKLRVGDRVWMRHAKSGEVMEHVNRVVVVDALKIPGEVPTYRGEGKSFL